MLQGVGGVCQGGEGASLRGRVRGNKGELRGSRNRARGASALSRHITMPLAVPCCAPPQWQHSHGDEPPIVSQKRGCWLSALHLVHGEVLWPPSAWRICHAPLMPPHQWRACHPDRVYPCTTCITIAATQIVSTLAGTLFRGNNTGQPVTQWLVLVWHLHVRCA